MTHASKISHSLTKKPSFYKSLKGILNVCHCELRIFILTSGNSLGAGTSSPNTPSVTSTIHRPNKCLPSLFASISFFKSCISVHNLSDFFSNPSLRSSSWTYKKEGVHLWKSSIIKNKGFEPNSFSTEEPCLLHYHQERSLMSRSCRVGVPMVYTFPDSLSTIPPRVRWGQARSDMWTILMWVPAVRMSFRRM